MTLAPAFLYQAASGKSDDGHYLTRITRITRTWPETGTLGRNHNGPRMKGTDLGQA